MYLSVENLPEVYSPVAMNYKMRHNKNRPARYNLVWHLWWQINGKTQSGHERLNARVAMEEGLLSACELTRALVNHSQSMNIATFSTRDFQEQCRKSYVASLISGEQRIDNLPNVFSRSTLMKVIRESFLP